MALTKCPECGHEVSTAAAACPNCGAPVKAASVPTVPPPLLGVPPPPISSSGPPPIPVSGSDRTSSLLAPPRSDKKILRMFIVPGLGLLGAYFDIYTGWTVLGGIDTIRSDTHAFAEENPLVAFFLSLMFPEINTNVEQAIEALKTAALILFICGVIGALVSLLFFGRRLSKLLAVGLIVCGVAPMFHHPAEFWVCRWRWL